MDLNFFFRFTGVILVNKAMLILIVQFESTSPADLISLPIYAVGRVSSMLEKLIWKWEGASGACLSPLKSTSLWWAENWLQGSIAGAGPLLDLLNLIY